MDKKKLVILTLISVLLVGGIIFFIGWLAGKKEADKNGEPLSGLIKKDANTERIRKKIEGKIKTITEGTLEVEDSSGLVTSLKIDGSTPVFFIDGNKQAELRQLADLRVSETVSIDYDEATGRVLSISVR